MTSPEEAARAEILARLHQSREELRRVLEPPGSGNAPGDAASQHRAGAFPRSRTMQMLMSGRGLKTLGALAAGLLIARPAMALRLLRLLPAGAVAKTLLLRTIAALRTKPQ
jgi:enoyl-CoA hydratase/carnithine racemase